MHELALHFRPKGGVKEYYQEDSSLLMLYLYYCTSITSAPDDLSQFSVPVSVPVPVPVPAFRTRDFQLPGKVTSYGCQGVNEQSKLTLCITIIVIYNCNTYCTVAI